MSDENHHDDDHHEDDTLLDSLDAAEREALPPLESKDDKIKLCATFDQNDVGNAKRMITHFGRDMLVVREVGFCQWSGTHWEVTGGEERIAIFAQMTAKLIEEEAAFIKMTPAEETAVNDAKDIEASDDNTEAEKTLLEKARNAQAALGRRKGNRRKFALSSGNNGKLQGMIRQAAPHITIRPEEMDADPMVFNCRNGTLYFKRAYDPDEGSFLKLDFSKEHNRDDRLAKCAPVNYDPNAQCPHWLEFLERFQPDEERRTFLQVFSGYCLTGLTDEQKLIFNYGKGANGKSTFVEALSRLLGAYAGQLNPESVTGTGHRRGDQATPDLAPLVGKRMVRVSELPKGQAVKEDLIKVLTGGEPMMVRHLNKGFFDFSPIFKAIMSGNDMPFITGTDWGIWRRLLIVPWEVIISEEEKRPMAEVLAEFDAERSGILNWLLRGLEIYINEGLKVPQSVKGLTESYKSELDPIQNFIDACLLMVPPNEDGTPSCSITGNRMYEIYTAWCKASGLKPFAQTGFGLELPKKGLVKENKRVRRYINVAERLPPEVEEILNQSSHTLL